MMSATVYYEMFHKNKIKTKIVPAKQKLEEKKQPEQKPTDIELQIKLRR